MRLEARASNGTISGRWTRTQRSERTLMTTFKMKLPATRAQVSHPLWSSRFSLQKQLTQKVAAITLENPTSNLQRASRPATQQLADTRAWTRWWLTVGRPKLGTELLASCFDDPRQGRQTGSNQTKRDNRIVHRRVMVLRVPPVVYTGQGLLWHCPWLQFFWCSRTRGLGVPSQAQCDGYNAVTYLKKL